MSFTSGSHDLDGVIEELRGMNEYAAAVADRIERRASSINRSHTVSMAFAGGSGAGKSFLINKIIGVGTILPSISGKACTAVVISVKASLFPQPHRFTVRVEYATRDEWHGIISFLCDCLTSEDTFHKAREELIAAYARHGSGGGNIESELRKFRGEISDEDRNEVCKELAGAWRGTERILGTESVEGFHTAESASKYIKKMASSLAKESDWRIIRRVTVEISDCDWLRGIEILDLPGTNDTNLLRSRIHRSHFDSADHVVVVLPAQRAATDESADYFFEKRSRMIIQGRVKGSAMSVVVTQTDTMDASELSEECGVGATAADVRKWLMGQVEERIVNSFGVSDSSVRAFATAKGETSCYMGVRAFLRSVADGFISERNRHCQLILEGALNEIVTALDPDTKRFSDDDHDMRRAFKVAARDIETIDILPSADSLLAAIDSLADAPEVIVPEHILRVNVARLQKVMRTAGQWFYSNDIRDGPFNAHVADVLLRSSSIDNEWDRYFDATEKVVTANFKDCMTGIITVCADKVGAAIPDFIIKSIDQRIMAYRADVQGMRHEISHTVRGIAKDTYSPTFARCAMIKGKGSRRAICEELTRDCRKMMSLSSGRIHMLAKENVAKMQVGSMARAILDDFKTHLVNGTPVDRDEAERAMSVIRKVLVKP